MSHHARWLLGCAFALGWRTLAQDLPTSSPDIDPNGPCKSSIEALPMCKKSQPPNVPSDRMTWCLRMQAEKATKSRKASPVSEACEADIKLWDLKATQAPLTYFPEIQKKCESPLKQHCNQRHGEIQKISCLEARMKPFRLPGMGKGGGAGSSGGTGAGKGPGGGSFPLKGPGIHGNRRLPLKCDIVMFNFRRWRASRLEYDPILGTACANDAKMFCGEVRFAGDRRKCLQTVRQNLTLACREALFGAEVKIADAPVALNSNLANVCKREVNVLCADVEPIDGQVLECLWKNGQPSMVSKMTQEFLKAQKKISNIFSANSNLVNRVRNFGKDTTGEMAMQMGDRCFKAVKEARVRSEQDYRLNPAITRDCNGEMTRLCSIEKEEVDRSGTASGKVMNCLKKRYFEIANEACSTTFKGSIKTMSMDWRADKLLYRECQGDALTLCYGTPNLLMHQCLTDHVNELEPACREEEFTQSQLQHADINFNPLLKRMCAMAIDRWCTQIPSGDRVLECLKNHVMKIEQIECKEALEDDEQRTSRDFRLRWGVSHHCQDDISRVCSQQSALDRPGGEVLQCMIEQENAKKIQNPLCSRDIGSLIKSEAISLKNNQYMRNACQADAARLCSSIEPGHGRLQDCLFDHIIEVSEDCAKAEFGLQQAMTATVQMNPRLEKACKDQIEKLCKNVPDTKGEQIRCLEDNKLKLGEGTDCEREITRLQRKKNRDYRLSPMLKKYCEADIKTICIDEKEQTKANVGEAGAVIKCLLEKRTRITNADCHKSVMRKAAQQADNYLIIPGMKTACESDVQRFCRFKDPGNGRMHECLAKHLEDLSFECQDQEFLMQVLKSQEVELNPWLMTACRGVLIQGGLCANSPKNEKMACLFSNRKDVSKVSERCNVALEKEAKKRGKSIMFNPAVARYCEDNLKVLIKQGKCPYVSESKQDEKLNGILEYETLDGSRMTCLIDNIFMLKRSRCRKAVREAAQMQLSNPLWSRPGMWEKCQADITKLCPSVNQDASSGNRDGTAPGTEGTLLDGVGSAIQNPAANPLRSVYHISKQIKMTQSAWDCIRKIPVKSFAPPCGDEVKRVNNVSSFDVRLHPQLQKACSNEITSLCMGVTPGGSRMLACLKVELANQPKSFTRDCKQELDLIVVSKGILKTMNTTRNQFHRVSGMLKNSGSSQGLTAKVQQLDVMKSIEKQVDEIKKQVKRNGANSNYVRIPVGVVVLLVTGCLCFVAFKFCRKSNRARGYHTYVPDGSV